jgi:glutamine synthetase
MAKYKLEYIWLDGYEPVRNLRSKTQLKDFASFPKLEALPKWGFDGSSTQQAPGGSSDCVLVPVAVNPDNTLENRALFMCEDYNAKPTLRRLTVFWLSSEISMNIL